MDKENFIPTLKNHSPKVWHTFLKWYNLKYNNSNVLESINVHQVKHNSFEHYLFESTEAAFLTFDFGLQLRMLFEHMLEHKIYVQVQPLDDWNDWYYTLLLEDIMSPFYSIDSKEKTYKSEEEALMNGIIHVFEIVKYNQQNGSTNKKKH